MGVRVAGPCRPFRTGLRVRLVAPRFLAGFEGFAPGVPSRIPRAAAMRKLHDCHRTGMHCAVRAAVAARTQEGKRASTVAREGMAGAVPWVSVDSAATRLA